MFITVYTYRAKPGAAEAVIALHDVLLGNPGWRGGGFISGELLRSLEDPQEFVEVSRFEDEAAARATTVRPEYLAWYRQLIETLEAGPVYSHFHTVRSTAPGGLAA